MFFRGEMKARWTMCILCLHLADLADARETGRDTYDYIIDKGTGQCTEINEIEYNGEFPVRTEINTSGEKSNCSVFSAGSAGSVLANRLSENPEMRVLLLEAGGDESTRLNRIVPMMSALGLDGPAFWQYPTVPQNNTLLDLPERVANLAAGKLLGGSSMVNYLIYSRGSSLDYDGWESGGADGWGFEDVLPYFLKAENVQTPELKNSEYHSSDGPLGVSEPPHQKLGKHLMDAATELGIVEGDCNQPHLIGVCRTQLTTKRGKRHSTYHAYLKPAKHRSNLRILKNALVTKILIENGVATGVEYIIDTLPETAISNREVIVSAGAIGSPKLLMLSGIGPRDHLEELGIEVKSDLPVGENFQNQMSLALTTCIDRPGLTITMTDLISPKTIAKYITTGKGNNFYNANQIFFHQFFSLHFNVNLSISMSHICFDYLRLPMSSIIIFKGICHRKHGYSIFVQFVPSNQFSQRYFQHFRLENTTVPRKVSVQVFSLLHPKSRGTVQLHSTDPLEPPRVDPNYLDHPDDVTLFIKSIRYLANNILNTSSLGRIGAKLARPSSVCGDHVTDSDAYWECVIRHSASAGAQMSSTCKMGSTADPTTVVDPQLRVKGIDRLRVVDTSVMPDMISGNTNAPAIMIAEKAADIIKGN
ncbi:hypothetical protein ScPMuIL_003079 [Solemya velum]